MVAGLIPAGAAFAEIGSDHGLISLYALGADPTRRAVLSDNKEGPYLNSLAAVRAAGLGDRALVRLADGLSGLPDFVDTLVLAGMGGRLIAEILSAGLAEHPNVSTLVLQPQSEHAELFGFLSGSGFRHVAFAAVEEGGHFYRAYELTRGKQGPLSELDLAYGPLRKEGGDAFREMLAREIAGYSAIGQRMSEETRRRYRLALLAMEEFDGNQKTA